MAYPSRPDKLKKRALTVSMDALTIERINALVPETGKRSERILDWLEAGLVSRFGPDWRVIADSRIAQKQEGQAA